MIVLAAIVVLIVVGAVEQRRRAPVVPVEVWAWMLAEVEAHVARGVDPRVALIGVCLHGPRPLRAAARDAVAAGTGGGPDALVDAVRARIASATGDTVCAAVAAVARNGQRSAPELARVRGVLATRAAQDRRIMATRRRADAASWLLLSPVTLLATGDLVGWAAAGVAGCAVAAWWGCRTWIDVVATAPRVFAGPTVPDRAV